MAELELSLSCGYYDRTAPLFDGKLKTERMKLLLPPVAQATSIGSPDADIYEAPFPSAVMQGEKKNDPVCLAIFPRRKFFHQLLLTRKHSEITRLENFRGKRVGILRWYQHALGVWLRGHLREKFGIEPAEMRWFTERPNLFQLDKSRGVSITVVPSGKNLVQMLIDGELDILIDEDAHRILSLHSGLLRRVFPNFREIETAYFVEKRFFPINHVMVIKREIVTNHPWVVAGLLKAFEEAKRIALDALDRDTSLLSSPWVASLLEEQYSMLGRDLYPYGLEPNRRVIETHIRYLFEQGLISKALAPEEIFARENS